VFGALLILAATTTVVALVTTRSHKSDARFVATVLWLVVHVPIYTLVPRIGLGAAAGTLAHYLLVVIIVQRLTPSLRLWPSLAVSVATILTVTSLTIVGYLLRGYTFQIEGP
jgi:hypothetical protein